MNIKTFIIGIGVIGAIVLLAMSYFHYGDILRNMINPLVFLAVILISVVLLTVGGVQYTRRFQFSNYDRLRVRMLVLMLAVFISPPLVLFINNLKLSSEETSVDSSSVSAVRQSRFGELPGMNEREPDFYKYIVRLGDEEILVYSVEDVSKSNRDIILIENAGMLGVSYYELR